MLSISRRSFVAAASAAGMTLLAGCSGSPSASSRASAAAGGGSGGITVGTLATEDILPFWVARDEGLFAAAGIDVEIVTFQSATELIAGIASGEVDLAMTDIMVTAGIFASGTDVQMKWVTLGMTPSQGRFGIMVGPGSDARALADLAGIPIGVGSNTILEYVMDRLMEDAGVTDDQIIVEELQKLPVRYQAMLEGEVEAAALPGTLLALGETNGCRLIADDARGENLSQSVMIARTGVERIDDLEAVWNEAVALVNANPEAYRSTLVENANLPEAIASTYEISEYPTCERPTAAMVDPVLAWMREKGYLTRDLTYDPSTGAFE